MNICFKTYIILHFAIGFNINSQSKDEILLVPNLGVTNSKSAVIFSLKPGFHTSYDRNSDDGFNSGFLLGANAEVQLDKIKYAGFYYEFWKHSDDEYKDIDGSIINRTYTGNNLALCLVWRTKTSGFTPLIGAGLGFYWINTVYSVSNITNTYFNLKIIAGFDIKINKILSVSSDVSFNQLINYAESKQLFSFKIGPTLILN
jgi:hypothetical protein